MLMGALAAGIVGYAMPLPGCAAYSGLRRPRPFSAGRCGQRPGASARLSQRQRTRRLPDDESDRAAFDRLCVGPRAQGAGTDQQAAGHPRYGDSPQFFALLAAQRRHLHRARLLRDRQLRQRATVRGFEWKIIGLNPRFAYYGGINVGRNALSVFLVSGGVAGLAGAEQVLGVYKAYLRQFLAGLRLRRHRGRHARQEQSDRRHLRGLSVRRVERRQRRAADDDWA